MRLLHKISHYYLFKAKQKTPQGSFILHFEFSVPHNFKKKQTIEMIPAHGQRCSVGNNRMFFENHTDVWLTLG